MRRRQRGMTLVEIMVVIAILAALAGAVAVVSLKHHGDAMIDRAKMDLRAITQAMDLYRVRHGRFPDPAQDLSALRETLALTSTRDPWGNAYVYNLEGGRPVIRSYGDDGQPGGDGRAADLLSTQLEAE